MRLPEGLIQVYTGDGKGKTTAAIGLGLRALGAGLKVICFQFLKGRSSGEVTAIETHLPGFQLEREGQEGFALRSPNKRDIKKTKDFFNKARLAVISGHYDLVILDEINVAIDLKAIGLGDVLRLLEEKPSYVELILTGRNAPKTLIDRADLVTEMVKIKHPFDRGVKARRGIEE